MAQCQNHDEVSQTRHGGTAECKTEKDVGGELRESKYTAQKMRLSTALRLKSL